VGREGEEGRRGERRAEEGKGGQKRGEKGRRGEKELQDLFIPPSILPLGARSEREGKEKPIASTSSCANFQ
jgi:hypothetical protein